MNFRNLSLSLLLTKVSSFSPISNPTTAISNVKTGFSYQGETKRLMCGLIAAIDDIWDQNNSGKFGNVPLLNDYDKENTLLQETTKKLYHRGPDGQTCASGSLGDDKTAKKARWAMGHTRLAIVDPNNRKADMPFQLDFEVDGKTKVIKLAANGEIYNHEQVYKNLVENDGWNHDRISQSDCEVIAHSFAMNGGPATAKALDGMFALVVFEENSDGTVNAFAARDPVGIKPLYYGRKSSADDETDASSYVFSSELKALVGQVDPSTVVAIPAGHYWTPEEGLVCYYNPDWLRKVRGFLQT
jgi:asparagine synthase (glutamine-hydrolysing)